jgi:hypothetical protein
MPVLSSQPFIRLELAVLFLVPPSIFKWLSRKGAGFSKGEHHLQGNNAQKESNQILKHQEIQAERKPRSSAAISAIRGIPQRQRD